MLTNYYINTNVETYMWLAIGAAILCGFAVAFVYKIGEKNYSTNLFITLCLMPVIAMFIVLLVNRYGNIGVGVAVGGAFALIRFRSAVGSSRDIVLVFLTMGIGIAFGTGLLWMGLILTTVVCTVYTLLKYVMVLGKKSNFLDMELRITTPDDLDYQNEYKKVFDECTNKAELCIVKTKNMGALYEVTYRVNLKTGITEKKFVDDLRVLNRNLPIILTLWSLTREYEGI